MYDKEVKTVQDITLKYLYFMDKQHPLSDKKGRVWHHRHVASLKIGRWVSHSEHVHHIDGNRANNNPENLEVVTPSEHWDRHKVLLARSCLVCDKEFYPRKDKQKTCSTACAHKKNEKIKWPTLDELVKEVEETSYSATGRRLGVSDNAVKKRIDRLQREQG